MEQALGERRLLGHVQLGKQVEEMTGEVTQLADQGRFLGELRFEAHETKGDALLTTKLLGQTFQTNMDKIWTCLMQDEVLIIGVYGMGGVRKTTLVTHIHNKLIENPYTFDHVFWITVSQDFSIHKLQNDIAKIVHLDLSNVDDEKERAAKLAQTLMRRQQSINDTMGFQLVFLVLWHFGQISNIIPCVSMCTFEHIYMCKRE